MGATRAAALVAIENRAAALVAYSNRAATWKSHCLAPRGKLFQVKALPYDIAKVIIPLPSTNRNHP